MIHTTIAIRIIDRQLAKRDQGTKSGHWDWLNKLKKKKNSRNLLIFGGFFLFHIEIDKFLQM